MSSFLRADNKPHPVATLTGAVDIVATCPKGTITDGGFQIDDGRGVRLGLGLGNRLLDAVKVAIISISSSCRLTRHRSRRATHSSRRICNVPRRPR